MTALGPEPLHGWRLRDYDDLIATLGRSRESQRVSFREAARRTGGSAGALCQALRGEHDLGGRRLFVLADALGYDLALVPRDPRPDPTHCDGCGGPCRDETAPFDGDAPSAPTSEPQGDENASGVVPVGVEAPNGPEAECDCGHEGLDAMWHLRPCPIAERRVAEAAARLRSLRQQPHSWTPNCGEACNHDTDEYPLQEAYPGSGIYE